MTHFRGSQIVGLIVAAAVIAAVGGSSNLELINVGTLTAIWAVWGSSLNLVWGLAGDFSMAQVGIGAFAAYTEAVLVDHYDWSFWPAAGAALGVAILSGIVIGSVAARLSGFYYSIMTLAFGLAVVAIAETLSVAGRSTGLPAGLSPGTIRIGSESWNLASRNGGFFVFSAILAALVLVLIGSLSRSHFGEGMKGVREDPHLATSVGINVARTRLRAFLLGAAVAGVGGILYGGYLGFILPSLFQFTAIITMVVQVVLGGRGFVLGPLVGAGIYVVLTDWVRVGGQYSDGAFGVILIVVILLAPDGVLGVARDCLQFVRGRRRHRKGHTPSAMTAVLDEGSTIRSDRVAPVHNASPRSGVAT